MFNFQKVRDLEYVAASRLSEIQRLERHLHSWEEKRGELTNLIARFVCSFPLLDILHNHIDPIAALKVYVEKLEREKQEAADLTKLKSQLKVIYEETQAEKKPTPSTVTVNFGAGQYSDAGIQQ